MLGISRRDPSAACRQYRMATPATAQMTEKFHIWLVEDSEADELLMRQAIRLDGIECDFQVSEDGEKAINYIEAIDKTDVGPQPHIVLLDLNLPRKSGARVLERIRQSPKCGHVPVLIVTSSDSA